MVVSQSGSTMNWSFLETMELGIEDVMELAVEQGLDISMWTSKPTLDDELSCPLHAPVLGPSPLSGLHITTYDDRLVLKADNLVWHANKILPKMELVTAELVVEGLHHVVSFHYFSYAIGDGHVQDVTVMWDGPRGLMNA